MIEVGILALAVIAAVSLPVRVLLIKKFDKSKIVAMPIAFVVSVLVFAGVAVLFGVLADRSGRSCPSLITDGCLDFMLVVAVLIYGLPLFLVGVVWLAMASAHDE